MSGAADPADLALAAKQLRALRREHGIAQDKAHQAPAQASIRIHPRDHFLAGVAALGQAEGLPLQVGLRWDYFIGQVCACPWQPGFEPERLARLGSEWLETHRLSGAPQAVPGRDQLIGREQDLDIRLAGFLRPDQKSLLPANLLHQELQRLEPVDVGSERGFDELSRLRAADEQESPGLGAVFHLSLGAIQEELPEGL